MTIDFPHFTPWPAFAGGLLIGVAAAILILMNRRSAGISGIIGALLHPNKGDLVWRLPFIGGLILAPSVFGIFYAQPEVQVDASFTILTIAG